jgi:hypothetical protein
MIDEPPFKAGSRAAREGQPLTSNPHHKPEALPSGANWPGDWACWQWGWITETGIIAHDKKLMARNV